MFFTNPNQDNRAVFANWWKDLALFSKFIFVITIATSILSLFMQGFVLFVLCFNPLVVTQMFTIWQFFTFPFACLDPLSALFSLCSFMPICGKKERVLGTVRFIIYFVIQNFTIALIFIPLYYFLYYIGAPPDIYFMKLFLTGLWPAIMINMVLMCNENGEEITQFMCFPVEIKRKWYPWAFFLLFSLIFGVIFNLLAGILVGYLYLHGFMKWTEMSDSTAQNLESKLCCYCPLVSKNFITVEDCGSELPGLRPAVISSPQTVSRPSQPVVPFSGAGHRLGGDEPASYAKK